LPAKHGASRNATASTAIVRTTEPFVNRRFHYPYPTALRERAVRRYQDGLGTHVDVTDQYGVGVATLERWVRRGGEMGSVARPAKAGGWRSPVDLLLLHPLVAAPPDTTTGELTRAYNRRVGRTAGVHRSSVLRALQPSGYA
jgi:hypothetical protein